MVKENSEKLETKKIVDLDEDEELVKAQVMLPEKWYERLGDIAHEKGMSRGALIRDSLKDWFAKAKKPIEENPEAKISDKELQTLLDECRTYFGGFETIGEDGFFEKFTQKKWKFSDLTDSQFITVCQYLKAGYDGFLIKPSVEEFVTYIEELEATPEQCELLKLRLNDKFEFEDTDFDKTIEEVLEQIKNLEEVKQAESEETE